MNEEDVAFLEAIVDFLTGVKALPESFVDSAKKSSHSLTLQGLADHIDTEPRRLRRAEISAKMQIPPSILSRVRGCFPKGM
jgi:hypothetical protein